MSLTTKTAIALLAIALGGACGQSKPATTASVNPAAAPTTTAAPTATAPMSATPSITAPDLTDVDKALADIDTDLRASDLDAANEGEPSQ